MLHLFYFSNPYTQEKQESIVQEATSFQPLAAPWICSSLILTLDSTLMPHTPNSHLEVA